MKPADRDLAIAIRHYVTGSLLPMPRATSLTRHSKSRGKKIESYPILSRRSDLDLDEIGWVVIQGLIAGAWSLMRVLEHPGHPCATYAPSEMVFLRRGLFIILAC